MRIKVHNGKPAMAAMSDGQLFLELIRAHKRPESAFKHNWLNTLRGEARGRGWLKGGTSG